MVLFNCCTRWNTCYHKNRLLCIYSSYHKNVTGLLKNINIQIDTLNDLSLSFSDWLNSGIGRDFGQLSKAFFTGLLFLIIITLFCCFWCLPGWCQGSFTANRWSFLLEEVHLCCLPWIQLPLLLVTAIYKFPQLTNVDPYVGTSLLISLFIRKKLQKTSYPQQP